jgi:hypothetical protein
LDTGFSSRSLQQPISISATMLIVGGTETSGCHPHIIPDRRQPEQGILAAPAFPNRSARPDAGGSISVDD